MLPPKDEMNEQTQDRYRKIQKDSETMPTPDFGPPSFEEDEPEDELSQFMNQEALRKSYDELPDDFYDEDDNSESDNIDHDDIPAPVFGWQSSKNEPIEEERPSMRQPNNELLRDEALFPGGPSVSEVNAWKKQFEADDHTVHLTEVDAQNIFIWRSLSRTEYREIMALPNTDPLQREEIMCEVCVLFPANYNFSTMANKKAGVPAVLAQHIMQESGFQKPSPPVRL